MSDAAFAQINSSINSSKTGWRTIRFDEMAELVNDRVANPAESGVERYVGLEHLDSESLKIRRWGKPTDVEAQKLRFQPGDIIFAKRRAYQRKVAVADFEGICSAHAMVLRAREENVVKDFLPFFMQSETFFERALSISVGSLSPTINWKTLAGQQFTIPPKDQQQSIDEFLSLADNTVDKWFAALRNCEIFSEIFTKEVSSIGDNNYKIGELIELRYGSGLPEASRQNGDYKVVTSSGIVGTHNKFMVESPGIVVGRKGNAGSVFWIDENFFPIDTTFFVRLRNEKLNLKYCYLLLKTAQLSKLQTTTSIPGLNRNDVYNLNVKLPSLPVQEQISATYFGLLENISFLQAHINKSQNLRRQLTNNYL